ncbi:MAG: hypothetical protein ACRCTP_17605 [Aeromonas popoffii]|uniref:hypothetical protein n=1 Tax=Aeromonas popoffii TaxID=70856 RepID=UPI003F33D350
MAGANFEILFKPEDLQAAITAVAASSSDIQKASDRAARRTMQWMRARISKDVSASLGIPAAMMRTRLTVKHFSGSRPVWILFLGVNRMPVDLTGTVAQSSTGLRHRGGTIKGGFHKDVFSHGKKGWIRKKRARELGLKMPGLEGAGSGLNIDGRFPVLRISHDLNEAARGIMQRHQAQGHRQFLIRFEHELKHIKGLT